jgi:hypothetical protein
MCICWCFLPLLFAGCFSVATQDDLQAVADSVRATESAIIDALPLPIPKEPTKELIGWLSDILILGGGVGVGGLGAKKLWKDRSEAQGRDTL